MVTKRLTHLIALICLLPALTGCYDRTAVNLSTDPAGIPDQVTAGDPFKIGGFTRADGSHVKWEGHVSLVTPDSLYFDPLDTPRPKPATFGPASGADVSESFTLAIEDLRSIDVLELNGGKVVLTVLGMFLSVIVVAVAGIAAGGGIYGD